MTLRVPGHKGQISFTNWKNTVWAGWDVMLRMGTLSEKTQKKTTGS